MINNCKICLLCCDLFICIVRTYFKFSDSSFLPSGIWLHQFSGRFVRLLLTMFKQEERCPGCPETNYSPGVRNVHWWIDRLYPGRRKACQGGGGLPGGSLTALDTRISFPRAGMEKLHLCLLKFWCYHTITVIFPFSSEPITHHWWNPNHLPMLKWLHQKSNSEHYKILMDPIQAFEPLIW